MRFALRRLEQGVGGCYPIRIDGRLETGSYLIPRSSLEREAGKF